MSVSEDSNVISIVVEYSPRLLFDPGKKRVSPASRPNGARPMRRTVDEKAAVASPTVVDDIVRAAAIQNARAKNVAKT
jgi:hypothetical protein